MYDVLLVAFMCLFALLSIFFIIVYFYANNKLKDYNNERFIEVKKLKEEIRKERSILFDKICKRIIDIILIILVAILKLILKILKFILKK